MANIFRLEISVPKTATHAAGTITLTETEQVVQHVEIEYRKEKKRSSFLTVAMKDFDGKIASRLPDPAFADVPIRFSFAEADKQRPEEVFTGRLAHINGTWPMGDLEISAHDDSLDMRMKARYKTFSKLTPKQIVEKIAKDYSLNVDWDQGDAETPQRAFEVGLPPVGLESLSDWDMACRILQSVGLNSFFHKGKWVVRQQALSIYPVTFRPGDGRVVNLQWRISHVRGGGGGGGNNSVPVALENSGSVDAVKGATLKAEASKSGASARTHKRPVGGVNASLSDALSQDGTGWDNHVTSRRGRKDEATLTLNPTPGVNLTHLIPLSGFNAKVDGYWETVSLKHVIIPGDSGSNTTISMGRGISKGAAKQAGLVPFQYEVENA